MDPHPFRSEFQTSSNGSRERPPAERFEASLAHSQNLKLTLGPWKNITIGEVVMAQICWAMMHFTVVRKLTSDWLAGVPDVTV